MAYGLRGFSRAPHRTAALAHGLADIWLTRLDRGHSAGAWRRRKAHSTAMMRPDPERGLCF
jgi:hypothetical protein